MNEKGSNLSELVDAAVEFRKRERELHLKLEGLVRRAVFMERRLNVELTQGLFGVLRDLKKLRKKTKAKRKRDWEGEQ